MPKVIITMPAYRAERTLERTVADIPAGVADKLILVDDASPDDTVRLARELGINVFVHKENRGYGGNQKTCYVEALRDGADIVVMLHPDFQYDPKAVPLLIAPILAGDADMTFGSRFAGLGDPIGGGMPLYRYLGNRVTTAVENAFIGARFTDMHSGLRAYTRRCLLSMPFLGYSDDFMFDSQMLIDAVMGGQRVVEVPIMTRYTTESSSISIGRSIRYVTHGVSHAALQFARKGRRGHRSPVTITSPRRGRPLRIGPTIERECVLCGGHELMLVYPSNVTGGVPVEEFRCTTSAVSQHDDIVQCRRCGMVSAIPTLTHEDIVDNYTQVVDEMYLAEEESRRELFSWFVQRMAGYALKGRRLLEVGANVGLFLRVAADHGWDVRGVEPSKWAVQEGITRFGVPLRQGTIEDLDEPDASADAVVLLDVLEHISHPADGLSRLREVVDDEGVLILSTVNLSGLHARMRNGEWPWFIRSHLHYFSPETLHATLARAGFRMVAWEIVPRSFHLSYIAHRAAGAGNALGDVVERLARFADPKLPVGWLGDIAFVAARPEHG